MSLVSVLGAFGSMAGGGGQGAFGFLFGAGAINLLPVFYGVIGLIGGVVAGFIFNIAAKVTGGLVIDID